MSRVPITMMSRELDIRPYTPLIQGEGQLENLEVRNLPKELTDDLLDMHIEGTLEENDRCSAEYQCKFFFFCFFFFNQFWFVYFHSAC